VYSKIITQNRGQTRDYDLSHNGPHPLDHNELWQYYKKNKYVFSTSFTIRIICNIDSVKLCRERFSSVDENIVY